MDAKTTANECFWNIIWTAAALVGSPYLLYKLLSTDHYRKGLSEKMGHVPEREGDAPCIWLHAVSVGELIAARGLIEGVRTELPDCDVVISTTTPTGNALARQRYGDDHTVIYFPFDATRFVRRAFDRLRPSLVVLVELELWPNFLMTARRRDVPVLVVNGRVSRKSYAYYKAAWPALAHAFDWPAHCAMQTDDYREKLVRLGVSSRKVSVTGSMKYDAVAANLADAEAADIGKLLGLGARDVVLTGASTHPGEEEILLGVFERLVGDFPSLRLVLVPRNVDRAGEIARAAADRGHRVLKRTAVEGTDASREERPIVLVDTIGELPAVCAASDIVFVGKSLTVRGGHNMLEPAGLGKAVLFGPHVANFQQSADELVAEGAAVQVADAGQLEVEIRKLLENPGRAATISRLAREVVARNRGATRRHLELIRETLASTS